MSVAKANKLLAAGKIAGAVEQLVQAWRATPSARIARVAVALSARLPVQPLPAKVREREAAWHALAKKRDPAQLPTLLAGEWPVHPREARARVETLIAFGPDPRIVHALHGLWAAQRYLSNAGIVMWRKALRVLVAWDDPETTTLIRESTKARSNQSHIVAIFAKRKLPEPRELTEESALAAIEGTIASTAPKPTDTSALLAAVYDDPASDAARMVLADALLANGDPRGELIQLQLAPPSSKTEARIKSLLRAHEKAWLGDFGELIGHPVFRRGFVAEASVDIEESFEPERREWRTLEAIRLRQRPEERHYPTVHAFLAHDNLAGVRRVDGIPVPALAGLARDYDRLDVLRPLVPIRTHARTRTLAIGDTFVPFTIGLAEVFAWFDASPFASVDTLILERYEADLPHVWRWFQQAKVARVVLRPRFVGDEPMAWELAIERDGSMVATWWGKLFGEREPTGLGDALAALPANSLAALTLRAGVRLDAQVKKEILGDVKRGLRAHKPRTVELF